MSHVLTVCSSEQMNAAHWFCVWIYWEEVFLFVLLFWEEKITTNIYRVNIQQKNLLSLSSFKSNLNNPVSSLQGSNKEKRQRSLLSVFMRSVCQFVSFTGTQKRLIVELGSKPENRQPSALFSFTQMCCCCCCCVCCVEVSAPSEEQLRLQAELQRLQTARRRDEEEFETQKNVLHTQLQHEVSLKKPCHLHWWLLNELMSL